ncbi:hypothetical protein LH412_10510 [Yersinia intermedia]|uniref:hypothetical protein n=1 Tax=Yersinia intermedia TaxID=631 RepID=UPI001CFC4C0C|nr:hypothetical protein [Yersinia intermedia]MCB5322457.1 hypothetical protein [Yersinia intermedia]
MMKNETCYSDADRQYIRVHRQRRYRSGTVSTLVGLILVAINAPTVWAKVTHSTGPIEGRPPTAIGFLNVMFPGGTTAVAQNVVVATTQKPNDFLVATSSLILKDQDGDTGLSASLDRAAVTWVWKYNNVALTPAQLAAPFSASFLGKKLTVVASAPITVSSLTGVPTTSSPSTFSTTTYTLVVPAYLPVVRVNGVSFALDSGFPKTGFSQATFQFWMNGTSASGNSNYTFATDPQAPWVTVNPATGVVTFVAEPASAQTVNITITDTRTNEVTPYSFTIDTWFVNNGSNKMTATQADFYCAGLGRGYGTPSYLKVTNAAYNDYGTRAPDERLWDEWGDVGVFSSSGWVSSTYWVLESKGSKRDNVYLGLTGGSLTSNLPSSLFYVACSRTL